MCSGNGTKVRSPVDQFCHPGFGFLVCLLPLGVLQPITDTGFVYIGYIRTEYFILAAQFVHLIAELAVTLLHTMYDADEREFDMGEILPKYELGEVVAIAQSYMDVDRFHRKGKNAAYLEYLDSILPELKLHPGWTNKMFVKADLMPRHIEFTDRKVERLQDISDEDCLKEGIYEDSGDDEFPPSIFYEFEGNKDNGFDTPREAFAALIDKVSGKGTWESNPYVWAYEFELMK